MNGDMIKLGHGSGGSLSHRLIKDKLLKFFQSPLLAPLADSALIEADGQLLAFTTDSYVVDPIFFPGGDIGKLAVFGTVNDIAMMGAIPRFISCSLIIEEGFAVGDLDTILDSMRGAADAARVEIVTGDTKVVPRGKADRIFINTSGVGTGAPSPAQSAGRGLQPGDAVVVSGPLGEHGAAVLAAREGLNLHSSLLSDCAPLTDIAQCVFRTAERVPFMRDITRGGLATILNECLDGAQVGIRLSEQVIPVKPEVRSICELLGLDSLYLACEGRLVAVVDEGSADSVVSALRSVKNAEDSCIIGCVTDDHPGQLCVETPYGTLRLLQMLSGEQLPRIC